MAKDKSKDAVPEQDPLTQRVDAMMDLNKPDPQVVQPDKPAAVGAEPSIDIFKETGTAPKLPPKLMKEIKAEAGTEPEAEPVAVSKKPEVPEETTEPEPAAAAPAEPETETVATAEIDNAADKLSDPETDKAVTDIVANEGDELLAVEDARTRKSAGTVVTTPDGFKAKLAGFFKSKWTWLGVFLILVAVLAVPFTRYRVLGLVLKSTTSITVLDSKTATPVSNAEVTVGSASAKTDGTGSVRIKAPLGSHAIKISKQYYQSYSATHFTGFKTANTKVKLVATGRQVPITVLNKVTGQPLKGAEVKVLDTTAKTDAKGKATIVLPTKSAKQAISISLSGYNTANASVQVVDTVVAANTFKLTPAGHIYFLSNLSGTIDVVRTDLDGANRKVVLPGTGNEDPSTISLLAARDWHYLVLESNRDGNSQPSLYLVDTSNDDVTKIASGNSVSYSLIGWSGHYFVFQTEHNDYDNWKPGATTITSYDADTGKNISLFSSGAMGSDNASSQYQNVYDTALFDGNVLYDTTWYAYPGNIGVSGQQNTLVSIHADGTSAKTLKTVDSTANYFSNFKLALPYSLYLGMYANGSQATTYYTVNETGGVTQSNTITSQSLTKTYPTYLLSPSGNQNFWTDYRDGKNTLFTGDDNAGSPKQLATLSDYSPYGWYSDNYLLVSKNASELYIMPNAPLVAGQQPLKISDYYKPQQTYNGYGGGYGGL